VAPGYPLRPGVRRAGAGGGGHATHEAHAGAAPTHDRHAGHGVETFRSRFWISLALTIPTVLFGHMLPGVLGWHPPSFPGSALVAPLLGMPALFAGLYFLGGVQLFCLGVVGEYVGRIYIETKRRPRFIVEYDHVG